MAVQTPTRPSGRLRGSTGRTGASLRVVNGQGKTPAARAADAELELAVIRDEALASARRMRLVLLRSIWSTDLLAPAAKPLLHELERMERRLANPEGEAA